MLKCLSVVVVVLCYVNQRSTRHARDSQNTLSNLPKFMAP